MSISKRMSEALNKQFYEEFNSAYVYNSMSAYFLHKSLDGFSTWMKKQAGEEERHAARIHQYLNNHAERVFYAKLPEPRAEWTNPTEVFENSLKHERHISKCIHDLVRLAREDKDLSTESFLDWYVQEQVEEEASVQVILDKLKMVGDSQLGLFLLDKEHLTTDSNE